MAGMAAVAQATAGSSAMVAEASGVSALETTLQHADAMYDNPDQYTRQQLYDVLAAINLNELDAPGQAEVLWRLTRATYERSQEPSLPKEEKAALIREAYEHVQVGSCPSQASNSLDGAVGDCSIPSPQLAASVDRLFVWLVVLFAWRLVKAKCSVKTSVSPVD